MPPRREHRTCPQRRTGFLRRRRSTKRSNVLSQSPKIAILLHGGELPNLAAQTLRDYELLRDVRPEQAVHQSDADAFLWVRGGQALRPTALEECFWGLQAADWVTWRDTGLAPPPSLLRFAGPIGISRAAMDNLERKSGRVRQLPWTCRERTPPPEPAFAGKPAEIGGRVAQSRVLEPAAWREQPTSMLSRLIPLRWKEAINRRLGRPLFDLTYYLQFQPTSAVVDGQLLRHRDYATPPSDGRRRIALVIPTFDSGGAEAVLLQLAAQIDRRSWEVFVFATQSKSNRWRARWTALASHWYDLSALLPFEQVPEALYSLALNWKIDFLFLQNALAGYTVLPALKQQRPELVAADLNHNVDLDWDFFSATLDVAEHLDLRGVISEQGRRRLYDLGTPQDRIRVLPNGVDVNRFRPRTAPSDRSRPTIAFLGALVERKQPLLLVPIVEQLRQKPGLENIRCLVAGDGTLQTELRRRIARLGLADHFRLYGFVDDVRPVLAETDILVLPSVEEGVPLAILEAYAMQVPVVAANSGAMAECVFPETGVLVEPGSYAEDRFAETLANLLTDRPQLSRMGLSARAWATSERTQAQAHERYRQLLQDLAAQLREG